MTPTPVAPAPLPPFRRSAVPSISPNPQPLTPPPSRLAGALRDRYRIERELGAGGMAAVYAAHDLRHERDVAIKVLHPDLGAALGGERFLSEIRTTARLQHPHILPLLDSGEADGLLYYVMPLVAGETLRARLERERQLPLDDALRIATEVADALGYAHAHSIIHRDVKPENILLQGGHALVADFGIALAVQQAGGRRMTQTGLSLGTPQYMSPEQAMGERTIDARSDIYSLGAVTYEMLTGDAPFTGSSVQAVVARIMTEKPTPLRALRDTVPPHVERAVLRSLAKLPADRPATAEAFAALLRDGGHPGHRDDPGIAEPARPASRLTRLLVPALAVVTLASLALAAWALRSKPEAPGTSRLTVLLEGYYADGEEGPLLSPDDRTFLYGNMQSDMVLRSEARTEAAIVPGTAGSWSASFSPDGGSIVFTTGFPGNLKVVDLGTGAVRTLARVSALGYGTSWSDDGWIYYTADIGRSILRIRPEGGEPELVARVDSAESELVFRQPNALPGGKGLLFTRWRKEAPPDIVHLDLASGRSRVVTGGLAAWYVPAGYLVVVRPDGRLTAMRFAPGPGTIESRAVDLGGSVRVAIGGQPVAEVSARGSIVYGPASASDQLVRVTRTGQPSPVDPAMRGGFRSLALSPDGRRAAVSVYSGGRVEVWIKSLDDGPFTRVGSAGTYAYRMFWSPDGRRVGFTSDVGGQPGVFTAAADGTGAIEPLPLGARAVEEGSWTRDGRWLVVRVGSGSGRDLYAVRVGGDTTPVALATTEAEEYSPSVSPDGRWLAYGSDGSGKDEIFVRPFGSPGASRYQVSVGGGNEPLWSNSGRELFYRDLSGNLVSAAIAPGDAFQVTSRRVLFSTQSYQADVRNRSYAVSPDDQSFYFIQRGSANPGGVVVLRNWLAEVERELEGSGD